MASVFDVAKYILEKQGRMTTMKLQKLVYYSLAWSLVWDEKPLFNGTVKAWGSGPVVPELYGHHKGLYYVEDKNLDLGDSSKLTDSERATIDAVLEHYGDKSAQYLVDLTHAEPPWRLARGPLPPESTDSPEIKLDAIAEYYSSLAGAA
jgi:uncharacterized phage-associated protein